MKATFAVSSKRKQARNGLAGSLLWYHQMTPRIFLYWTCKDLSLISCMSLSKFPPCVKWAMEPTLVDGVSSKLHHIPPPPPSQQTLTLFCDYFASSFPNVHQIKKLLGHGRTCLWGRISFKVTAQPELTLLVFIQSMSSSVPMRSMFIFLQQSLHSLGCSFLFS